MIKKILKELAYLENNLISTPLYSKPQSYIHFTYYLKLPIISHMSIQTIPNPSKHKKCTISNLQWSSPDLKEHTTRLFGFLCCTAPSPWQAGLSESLLTCSVCFWHHSYRVCGIYVFVKFYGLFFLYLLLIIALCLFNNNLCIP